MIDQRIMNTSIAENFIRSTKAPTIRAGVMTAKVIWNVMNTDSGMTFENQGDPAVTVCRPSGRLSTPMPASRKRSRSPTHMLPSVNAKL